jgi:aldehyde:ferredoxin oxidoreductase
LKTEHAFNIAAGFSSNDDRLPEFFKIAPVAPHNLTWDMPDAELDSFWNF